MRARPSANGTGQRDAEAMQDTGSVPTIASAWRPAKSRVMVVEVVSSRAVPLSQGAPRGTGGRA
jgi:hypothetical protein